MAAAPNDFSKLSEDLAGPAPSESRLQKKWEESPFMVVGLTAGTGIAAYGLYNIRRSKIRVSYYLMQLRVAAQGTIVALLAGGAAVQLYGRLKRMYWDPPSEGDK